MSREICSRFNTFINEEFPDLSETLDRSEHTKAITEARRRAGYKKGKTTAFDDLDLDRARAYITDLLMEAEDEDIVDDITDDTGNDTNETVEEPEVEIITCNEDVCNITKIPSTNDNSRSRSRSKSTSRSRSRSSSAEGRSTGGSGIRGILATNRSGSGGRRSGSANRISFGQTEELGTGSSGRNTPGISRRLSERSSSSKRSTGRSVDSSNRTSADSSNRASTEQTTLSDSQPRQTSSETQRKKLVYNDQALTRFGPDPNNRLERKLNTQEAQIIDYPVRTAPDRNFSPIKSKNRRPTLFPTLAF